MPTIQIRFVNTNKNQALAIQRLKENRPDPGFDPLILAAERFQDASAVDIDAEVGQQFLVSRADDRRIVDQIRIVPTKYEIRNGEVTDTFAWQAHRKWMHTRTPPDPLHHSGELDELKVTPAGSILLYDRHRLYAVSLPLHGHVYSLRDRTHGYQTFTDHEVASTPGGYEVHLGWRKPTVSELGPPNKRLPNAEPALSSYDIRTIHGVRIKKSLKRVLFTPLGEDDVDYEITDANYIVEHGLGFNTLTESQETASARTIATTSELTEAWNIGVSLGAGDTGAETDPTPVGGKVSADYTEKNTLIQEQEALFSFGRGIYRSYELAPDPMILQLTEEFRRDVDRLRPADDAFRGAARALQDAIATYNEELWSSEENTDLLLKLRAGALDAVHEARTAFIANPVYQSAVRLVENWGTHYASNMTFGGARYETLQYDRQTVETLTEQGIEITLEAEGSIKGVPVNGEVRGGYMRSSKFKEAMSTQLENIETIGGPDMDSAEPVEVELRPLSDLLDPMYFADGSTDDHLQPRQEVLRRVIDDSQGFDEAARLLRTLRVFELEVMYFTVPERDHAPEVWGSVHVMRSRDPLQDDNTEICNHPGVALWARGKAPKVRVVARPDHQEPMNKHRHVYLFVPKNGPLGDLKFSIGVYIDDYLQHPSTLIANARPDIALKEIRPLDPFNMSATPWEEKDYPCRKESWVVDGVSVHVRYRESRFESVPPLKRQEVESVVRKSGASGS